jgi:hypothetical protein
VPAAAHSSCDPKVQAFGIDDGIVLRCEDSYAAYRVWVPQFFNEEPLTSSKLSELLALADGPMTDVKRLAVIGDDVGNGVSSIDRNVRNPEPYEIDVELDWFTPQGGRPCNRVGDSVVEPMIDEATGIMTTKVTWTERVGDRRFQFCGEPTQRLTVTDANGDPVPFHTLTA